MEGAIYSCDCPPICPQIKPATPQKKNTPGLQLQRITLNISKKESCYGSNT
jgi:hypothetical protein